MMVKRRVQSSVNIARTRSFPGADTGSDHELVMMTFRLHLKKVNKQGHTRIKFDLEKLKDPSDDRNKICTAHHPGCGQHRSG